MKRGVRGQVSVEYLLVLGMAMLLLLPGGYLFYSFSQGNQDQVAGSRLNDAGNRMIAKVEEMYAVGQNSWSTVRINVPDNVEAMYVLDDRELVMEYETQTGLTEVVFFSKINMTTPYVNGNRANISQQFHTGLTRIKVTSLGETVELQEITS